VVGASSYESFKKDLDDSLAQLPLAAEATQTKQ
jgi:hypothetical protein